MVNGATAPGLTFFLLGSALNLGNLMQLAALATVVAGVFVVARYRETISAGERARSALKDERDAAVLKADRLGTENAALSGKVASLESRPDLRQLGELIETQTALLTEAVALLRELHDR
jgi:hypothetical protein